MNIYYDGFGRECVAASELYDEMTVKNMTGMSFSEWFQYMIESGFKEYQDYVKTEDDSIEYVVPVDVAKQFCRITASIIANEHNCFSEIFITFLVQDVIEAEVNRLKAHKTKEYVNRWKKLIKQTQGETE